MAFVAEQVTVVWPPTGIAIAALLVLGLRFWPAITLGAFLANVTTAALFAAALGIATGNTLEAVLPAWILVRFFDFDVRLERLKDAVRFILVAAIAGTAVSATIGVTSLCLGGVEAWSGYFRLWWVWWLGDAASALVIAPALLAAGSRFRTNWARGRLAEGAALCAIQLFVSEVVFADSLGLHVSSRPLHYVLFPFVIWAALRLGPPGTAAVVLAASTVAVWGTRAGLGPFSGGTVHENLFLLQAYLAVIATTGLVLSAVISEWKAAERRRTIEHAVASVLARCSGMSEAGPELLRAVGEGAEWDVGALWLVSADGAALRCQEFWHRPGLSVGELERATRERQFEMGIGLPGRVWTSGRPAWIEEARTDPNFPRSPAAETAGLHTGFGFPILLAGRVLGVIEFFCREVRQLDAPLLSMMSAIGSQIGQFMERKRAEEALHAAREQLEIVTDTMFAAITRCSRDFRYIWVSERYAQWLGRRCEDIEGHLIADIIGEQGLASLRTHIEVVLSGEAVEYEEFVSYTGCGDRWIHAVYSPTFDKAGNVDGWVAVVHDVSAHKQAEEALKEAARRKDEFLSMLAHELRNPLAPIRTAANLLQIRGDDPALVGHARGVIDRQVAHLARLVDDLLDTSRISRGKISLHRDRLDIAKLARVTASDHRQRFIDAGVALVVDIPEGPLWVNGDATRLTQVLDNLLENARKFSNRFGTVTFEVTAEPERGCVFLRVRDTGVGIESRMLTQVFDVFSQADRSLDRSRGGLGLGLAIVKGLVELHQGEVKAASDGPGRGSEFTITLPLETEPSALSENKTPDRPAAAKRLQVLVIEDNRDAADSLKALLEAYGHEAAVAYTGTEGVEMALRMPLDAVVCDIGLPGMDGFAVAHALRRNPETAHVRLIAVTGYGQEDFRAKALAAGFDDHLLKPADPARLLDLLN